MIFFVWKITHFFSYSKKQFWTHMITYKVLFTSKKYFREKLRKVLVHRVISNFNLLILPKKETILFTVGGHVKNRSLWYFPKRRRMG